MLSACVTRPPNTDLFGRPLTPPDARPSASASSGSTVGDDTADSALDGIVLAAPRPQASWSAANVTIDARTVSDGSYTVVAGDTLRGIGNRTGAGSEAIAAANNLLPPYTLAVGQRLTIPGGRYHEVRAGESGIAIARAYGVEWSRIVADNGLTEPFVLRVGQRLRLPPVAGTAAGARPSPGTGTTPRSVEQMAQEFTLDIDDIVTGGQPAGAIRPALPPASEVSTSASASARFAWPINGRVIQRFGPAGGGRVNEGIGIAASRGTPVTATADGTVAYAGSDVNVFGGLILIEHAGGWVSAYGHLDRVAVQTGDRVARGTVIATSGESGQVDVPQLYFQLRQNRRPVDPLRQLPAR
ncbi:MAG: M23 family metallopeptidase [Sphingopyxis sp.]|nr:M23 family metallopeptidase [Sphingopyxis sp.]